MYTDNWMPIRRGDVYYADLTPVMGSEQGGVRPVVILQNDVGNRYSPTVIAAAITSSQTKPSLPTHVSVGGSLRGLYPDSIVLLEQVRTLDKSRLHSWIGAFASPQMEQIDRALGVSVGLIPDGQEDAI